MTRAATCHCCGEPATDRHGQPKSYPICWTCICHAGSVGRRCALHNPQGYANALTPTPTQEPSDG